MQDDNKIELSESYKYFVTIGINGVSFAGELSLAPGRIVLRFGGDTSSNRCYDYPGIKIDTIECKSASRNFILFGLHEISMRSQYLPDNPEPMGSFEVIYEVGHVVVLPISLDQESINSVQIHSSTFSRWLGYTTTQQNILDANGYSIRNNNAGETVSICEFACSIKDVGKLYQRYNVKEFFSLAGYSAGLTFNPSLNVASDESIKIEDVFGLYNKIYNLFSVLHGDELLVESIEICSRDKLPRRSGFVYYPTIKDGVRFSRSFSLFPLGKNLKIDTQGLPQLSEVSFENYFNLPSKKIEYWGKYIKYRRMKNIEERFLGYFRLLEALTYTTRSYLDGEKLKSICKLIKPDLIKHFEDKLAVNKFMARLPRLNNSKYNTEACMREFYGAIPEQAKEMLKLNDSHIESICRLRNDISHANDYYVSEEDLWGKCFFVEALLIFAMFLDIGISLSDTGKVIHRLH